MALTLDSAPSTRQLANFLTNLTYSFTYGGGSGAIYVACLVTTGFAINTVTWSGQSFSRLITHTSPSDNDVEIWQLLNPSGSGAANIVITPVSGSPSYILATTLSLLGSIGSGGATNTSTSATNTISVADGSWVVIAGASDTVDVAASTNVTSTVSANPVIGLYGPKSGAGNISLSYTNGSPYSIAVEVIDNAAGGGGSTVPITVISPNQATAFSSALVRRA